MNSKRELLERPFPPELVRTRPGRNGEEIRFLEGHVVVARLQESYEGEWSWQIEKHEILDDEVIVLGRLEAGSVVKSAFGSSSITRPRDGGKPLSIGDDLKAAATDSLKKCATLLGVGLNLHAGAQDVAPRSADRIAAPSANGHLSTAQLRAIHAIRRRLGWSETQLAEHAARLTGSRDVEQLSKAAASTYIERLQAEAAPASAAR
jgi:hypothetical protein